MDSICVQFKTSDKQYFGTSDELDWRHQRQDELDKLLADNNLGDCDGGQSGGGSMEIFLDVIDISKAVAVIEKYLTDNEWIQFSKIASLTDPIIVNSQWELHHPKGADFSPMEWL